MDTTTAIETTEIHTNRRTLRILGAVAVGAALTAGLVGCGTGASEDAESTTKATAIAPIEASARGDAASADDGVGVPAADPTTSGGGQSGGGGGTGQSQVTPPTIDSFVTPENIDCHNGNFQEFTASWTTSNAHNVTISIDGPGIYASYPADGETSLPFNCNSSHTFLLTAHGEHGTTATRTVTLDPRNVQSESSDEDEDDNQSMPAGTTAKVSGGSTGDGPASEHDCEVYAKQQDSLNEIAIGQLNDGDVNGAIATVDESERVGDQGMSLGCFFVYT